MSQGLYKLLSQLVGSFARNVGNEVPLYLVMRNLFRLPHSEDPRGFILVQAHGAPS
jgi:hypothetical protein